MKRRQTNQTTTQGAWSRVTEGVSDPMTVDIASRRCVEVGGSRVVVDYQRGPVYRVKGVQYAAGVQMFVDSVSVTLCSCGICHPRPPTHRTVITDMATFSFV